MKKVGIDIKGSTGIGDKIQFASLPEAYYKQYQVKLIDVHNEWIFDHNPYVVRLNEDCKFFKVKIRENSDGSPVPRPSFIYSYLDDWHCPTRSSNLKTKINGVVREIVMQPLFLERQDTYDTTAYSQHFYDILDIKAWDKSSLNIPRSPRLYKYEECKIKPNQISIHIGPSKSTHQTIPDYILKHIEKRYSNYNIVQVGGKEDKKTSFIDKRGDSFWGMAKTISESAIFICVNSGPMNMANCYPHVNKKLILIEGQELSREDIQRFYPRNLRTRGGDSYIKWVDYGWQYYNNTDDDLGATYSYKRI